MANHKEPRALTPMEKAEQKVMQSRVSGILQAFWDAHGVPETLQERSAQAFQLVRDFYPPRYPFGFMPDSPPTGRYD